MGPVHGRDLVDANPEKDVGGQVALCKRGRELRIVVT